MLIGPLGNSRSPVKNYAEVDPSIIVPRSPRVYVDMFMGDSRYRLTWKEFNGETKTLSFDDETVALSQESKLYTASLKNPTPHVESLDMNSDDIKTLVRSISECHEHILSSVNSQVENLKRLGGLISDLESKISNMNGGDSK